MSDFAYEEESTRRFFARFDRRLNVEGKTVLDVGCGAGVLCVEAAARGASRVVGVDIQELGRARNYAGRRPDVNNRITFVLTRGDLDEVGDERFDVVISKDSMEHFADPESFIHVITRFLKPGGQLVIAFAPFWKSPSGGHISFMTKVPWAHLLFPESVIMEERKRFFPDEDAHRFEEIEGGLNKMTFSRFTEIMRSTGLCCEYFETNVGVNPALKAMKLLSRIPPLREYLTHNVYSIWRHPERGERSSASVVAS